MEEVTITSKGQIVLPRAVQEYLGVKPGDSLRFFLHPEGEVVTRPVVPMAVLKGVLQPAGEEATIEEMNDAVTAEAAARNRP